MKRKQRELEMVQKERSTEPWQDGGGERRRDRQETKSVTTGFPGAPLWGGAGGGWGGGQIPEAQEMGCG